MQSIEGIIVKAAVFEESSHLLTIFSKECGIIRVIHKSSAKKMIRSFSQLLKVEATVTVSQKELWKCRELQIVASYQGLRRQLITLEIGTYLLKRIEAFLPPRQPVDELYHLLDDHLLALAEQVRPYAVGASFLLKLYQHEGVLPPAFSQKAGELLMAHVDELGKFDCTEELFRKIAKEGT